MAGGKLDDLAIWRGPETWIGRDIAKNSSWAFEFNAQHLKEIENAVTDTRKANLAIQNITRETFRLPVLGCSFIEIQREILQGRGFVILRKLPVDEWELENIVRAYWGIGCWFGDPVPQNRIGHLIGHIIDHRISNGSTQRIYKTNRAQPFHSDSCDIAGLLCLRSAKLGGASAIASAAAVHNYILETNPDELRTLYDVFYCDRYGEVPYRKKPFYQIRIFNRMGQYLTCCGMDPDIWSAQRLKEVPRLTQQQKSALKSFQKACFKFSFPYILKAGEIQLVHNHTVLHARGHFDDYPEPEKQRYLLRLWLSTSNGRVLPELMAQRWGSIKVGTKRGGITVPGQTPHISLRPDSFSL